MALKFDLGQLVGAPGTGLKTTVLEYGWTQGRISSCWEKNTAIHLNFCGEVTTYFPDKRLRNRGNYGSACHQGATEYSVLVQKDTV